MASNTKQSATCGVCKKPYNDPRLLPCLHSFCKKCLLKEVEGEGSDQELKCPTCKKRFHDTTIDTLPQDLRKSYEAEVAMYESKLKDSSTQRCDRCVKTSTGPAIAFCCDCCEFLCKACKEDHVTWRKTLNHEVVDAGESWVKKGDESLLQNIPHKPMYCAEHKKEDLRFFCKSCEVLVCRDCLLLKHKEHQYDLTEAVAEKEKEDLRPSYDDAEEAKVTLDEAIARGDKEYQRVKAKQKAVTDDINEKFNELELAIKDRKAALVAKTEEISLGKLTSLSIQSEELKEMQKEIASTCQTVEIATQCHTPPEFLSAKKFMKAKLQDLLQQFNACPLEPYESDLMPTSLDTTPLVNKISKFGEVTGGCYPSMSTAEIYITKAVVSKERKITIIARDESGKPIPFGGENVRAVFRLMGSNNPPVVMKVQDKVQDNDDGTYALQLTPQVVGEHELAVTIRNQPVKGSPFVISVREERTYTSLSQQQSISTGSTPWGIAFDDNGDLYVAEYGNHRISIYAPNGSSKGTLGTQGSGNATGQFNSPSDVAVRGDVVFVTDRNNHRVQKLSIAEKNYIAHFGEKGSGDGQLSNPYSICLDPEGKVFIADNGNNRVQVFTADGTFAYSITGNTSDGSSFQSPWGVAFDPSGNLHVVANGSNRVKIFTRDGKYVCEYGSGQLSSPSGIAIDEEGYSFVANYSSSNLKIFNPQYELINTVSPSSSLVGLVLDKNGFVFVTTSSNNRVLKY